MTDPLSNLRAEIAEAAAERDRAQAQYDLLAGPGERLQQAISEHRAQSMALAAAVDDDQYAERLAALGSLQHEIDALRASVDMSKFHDTRRLLAVASGRLGQLQLQYEERCWLLLPNASAHLFAAAEASRREYEKSLARIDSVAMVCHEAAHRQTNGVDPRLTAPWRCYLTLSQIAETLTCALGSGAARDFATGPRLVDAVHAGVAKFGDVARWTPPSRAVPSGEGHFNREKPLGAPVESEPPGPGAHTPEAETRVGAPSPKPEHAVLPSWLDTSPFRPPEPSG
jgi:hypothetical protein